MDKKNAGHFVENLTKAYFLQLQSETLI